MSADRVIRPRSKIVVALGGNALVSPGEQATVATQVRNVRRAMEGLVPLVRAGNKLIVTHGNGFQVGNILIRVEESLGKAYSVPLEVCVAESQGELGYLIEQTLQNVLVEHDLRPPVVSLLTQVLVDENDPAFAHPTKPIGPFYTEREAEQLRQRGFTVAEDAGRGWRKVVASPKPLAIDDVEVLQWMLRRGIIVIAAGGGGVPVVKKKDKILHGVPAVIDKDLASAVLATDVGARHLLILTGEPCAYLNYGKADQRPLRSLTVAEAERHLRDGQFAPGSMGPKVQAALDFLAGGGTSVVITSTDCLDAALEGRDGTLVTRRGARKAKGSHL